MSFQRSYSRVWWGSDNVQTMQRAVAEGSSFTSGGLFLTSSGQMHRQYSSLDYSNIKSYSGNLSRIQEVEDENSPKLRGKNESPGSLRSQDSGFSDNEESHSNRSIGGHSPKTSSPAKESNLSQNNCSSPLSASSERTVETPPTVIRRKKTNFFSPLVNVSRRISFSGTGAGEETPEINTDNSSDDLQSKLDRISFLNYSENVALTTNVTASDTSSGSSLSPCKYPVTKSSSKDKSVRRRRRVVSRKTSFPLSPTRFPSFSNGSMDDESDSCDKDNQDIRVPDYHNETVYFGIGENQENYNNNALISPLKKDSRFTASTSTPKKSQKISEPSYNVYQNPLLNGHDPALQSWLDDIRVSYENEVMSTLQTKSIAQEAFKNLKITTNTVTKIIRQLQTRSIDLQANFERIERVIHNSSYDALDLAQDLVNNMSEFIGVLERRVVFFTECRADRKKFEDNIDRMKVIARDIHVSLEKRLYIQLHPLLGDIQLLKRYSLITIRLVFEKLVRVIVLSIEQSKSDLMLRANINMIATLSNIDYEGFASLTDAFVQNETVRALLIVCLENQRSSVRALALRALATICSAAEAISQLGQTGGIEIIRDILQVDDTAARKTKRTESEKREAVSLLTQITAPWHGDGHHVEGLRDCVETIVEGLTDIITKTNCCQTLLLCSASLNNLSRIEPTSVYSIMSNETIIKLKASTTGLKSESSISIFFYVSSAVEMYIKETSVSFNKILFQEQIISMLHNMSGNKKCHSHLGNGSIINFITFIFESEFYKKFDSRAESEAQKRTIKSILHTFTRLIHESSLGTEILEHNFIPIFSKVGAFSGHHESSSICSPIDYYYSRGDISVLAKKLMSMRNESSVSHKSSALTSSSSSSSSSFNRSVENRSSGSNSALKFNVARQESYV